MTVMVKMGPLSVESRVSLSSGVFSDIPTNEHVLKSLFSSGKIAPPSRDSEVARIDISGELLRTGSVTLAEVETASVALKVVFAPQDLDSFAACVKTVGEHGDMLITKLAEQYGLEKVPSKKEERSRYTLVRVPCVAWMQSHLPSPFDDEEELKTLLPTGVSSEIRPILTAYAIHVRPVLHQEVSADVVASMEKISQVIVRVTETEAWDMGLATVEANLRSLPPEVFFMLVRRLMSASV